MGRMHVWAYGHTHFNNQRRVDGTLLLSNQRGYKGSVDPGYSATLLVELTSSLPEVEVLDLAAHHP